VIARTASLGDGAETGEVTVGPEGLRRGFNFVPIQNALSRNDALNEYLRHTDSSLWAVPPGVGSDGWWGQTLLG